MIVEVMHDAWKCEYCYHEEYANDDQYHHSGKGCEIEKRHDNKFSIGSTRPMEYLYCKTHNKLCSKTGWEFHHYHGSDSLGL